MKFVFGQLDYIRGLKEEVNWRELQKIQRDLILIGSKEVLSSYNKFVLEFDKANEQKRTKLVRDLWNSIRIDLYSEKQLPDNVDTAEKLDTVEYKESSIQQGWENWGATKFQEAKNEAELALAS